jgi:hypothetical protein
MKLRALERTHGRASHANFIGIPRAVADSLAFTSLTPLARALYVDLRRQYNGRNNGDICAADGLLGQYGWAHSTIHKLLKELVEHELIKKTRQGGIACMSHIPTLYGFTDIPIMANPAKQIKGEMPSLSYRSFVPIQTAKSAGKKKSKVHKVNDKVHVVNLSGFSA